MAILYRKKDSTITLNTKNSSYQMKIGRADYLLHLYYGPTISDEDLSYQIKQYDRGFSGNPYDTHLDRTFSLDAQPQEFTTSNRATSGYRRSRSSIQTAATPSTDVSDRSTFQRANTRSIPCLQALRAKATRSRR